MPENQFMLGLKDNAYFQSLPCFHPGKHQAIRCYTEL